VNVAELQPRHHAPPDGWDAQTFEAVTSALAAALSGAYRRSIEREAGEPVERPTETGAVTVAEPARPSSPTGAF
jgi:hypothetical protein